MVIKFLRIFFVNLKWSAKIHRNSWKDQPWPLACESAPYWPRTPLLALNSSVDFEPAKVYIGIKALEQKHVHEDNCRKDLKDFCETWLSRACLASSQALLSSSSFPTASFLRLTYNKIKNLQYSCFQADFNSQCISSALDDQPLCWEQPPPPLLSLLPTSFSSQPFPCSAKIFECKDLLVCTDFVQIFERRWLRVANTELHQFSSLSCFAWMKLCLYSA